FDALDAPSSAPGSASAQEVPRTVAKPEPAAPTRKPAAEAPVAAAIVPTPQPANSPPAAASSAPSSTVAPVVQPAPAAPVVPSVPDTAEAPPTPTAAVAAEPAVVTENLAKTRDASSGVSNAATPPARASRPWLSQLITLVAFGAVVYFSYLILAPTIL